MFIYYKLGIVIVSHEGVVIRSTLDNSQTQQYSMLISQLSVRGKSIIRDLDPEDDLSFIRIKTKKHEVLIKIKINYNFIDYGCR